MPSELTPNCAKRRPGWRSRSVWSGVRRWSSRWQKSLAQLELTAKQKRTLAAELATAYPVRLVCQVLELPRSTFYYDVQVANDEELKAAIEEVIATWPTYGYRRVTAQIRRDKGWVVNHKRVWRLMRAMGLQGKVTAKRRRTTNSQHPYPRYTNLVQGLTVERPDQVWACDITHVRLQTEFVYSAMIMDVFTRSIRGWHLARRLDHDLTLTALQQALANGRQPEIHHSDQGVQYAAAAYVQTLQARGIAISMAEVGQAKRLCRTLGTHDQGRGGEPIRVPQLSRGLPSDRSLSGRRYAHKRIHSVLDYLTPAEFESRWSTQHVVQSAGQMSEQS